MSLRETFRLSVEQCIRDHIAQDADFDSAVRAASEEIVTTLLKPIPVLPPLADPFWSHK